MVVKVEKCCCLNLRNGCIAISIVGVILGLIEIVGLTASGNPAAIFISPLALPLSVIGGAMLSFAVVFTTESIGTRKFAVFIYMITTMLNVFLLFIVLIIGSIYAGMSRGSGPLAPVLSLILIGLRLYFYVVANSYYCEFKKPKDAGGVNPSTENP